MLQHVAEQESERSLLARERRQRVRCVLARHARAPTATIDEAAGRLDLDLDLDLDLEYSEFVFITSSHESGHCQKEKNWLCRPQSTRLYKAYSIAYCV